MKSLILMIAASMLSLSGYCQKSDSISQRQINQAIAKGLECCQIKAICDSMLAETENKVISLEFQLLNEQERFKIKHGNWIYADSLYKASAMALNGCNYEVERLKKGKRNWIIATMSTVLISGVGVYFITK